MHGVRRWSTVAVLAAVALALVAPVATAQEPTVPDPAAPTGTAPTDTTVDPAGDPAAGSSTTAPSTTVIPPPATTGEVCQPFPPAAVVFVGTVTGKRDSEVTFRVVEVREGAIPEASVDVDYGTDVRFVRLGKRYEVAAASDLESGQLTSKVRRPRGEDLPEACVALDDVITRNPDGSAIDTGVLAGMRGRWGRAAFLVALPLLVALGVLLGLVLVKYVLVGIIRLPSWLRSGH